MNIQRLDSGPHNENHSINTISLESKAITKKSQSIWAVRLHPTQNILAVSSPDNTVDLYSINNTDGQHNLLMTLKGHTESIRSLSFSPDGEFLATGSDDQNIKLWNISTGELLHTLAGHSGSILNLSFRPGDQAIASASEDQTIRLWGTDGQLLSLTTKRYPEHEAPQLMLSVSVLTVSLLLLVVTIQQ